MKVSTQDILNIKKGTTSIFKCDTPRGMLSAQQLSYYAHKAYPEYGVRFTCKLNWNTNEITITANPSVSPKKPKS